VEPEKKKRVNKSKPVQRSLKHMEENGWISAIVEKWIPPRGKMKFGIRRDVWNFGDLLACRPPMQGQPGVTALVQCCSTDVAAHRWKCYSQKEFYIWRDAGNKVFLQSWQLRGAKGEKKRWTLVEEVLSEHAFMSGMGFTQRQEDEQGIGCGLWVPIYDLGGRFQKNDK
jgi:hypothetical protein